MSGNTKKVVILIIVLLALGIGVNRGCSTSKEVVVTEDVAPADIQEVRSAHEEMMMRGRANRQGAAAAQQVNE